MNEIMFDKRFCLEKHPNNLINCFLEYRIMPQLQQMQAFISSVGIQVVPQTAQLQLPNTKTEIGKSLATWPKLEIIMVQ